MEHLIGQTLGHYQLLEVIGYDFERTQTVASKNSGIGYLLVQPTFASYSSGD